MFSISLGWSKASNCKKLIKEAHCSLRRLKARRESMATQLRKDLAELLYYGEYETALKRVVQLIQDESLVAAYDLLDQYFEYTLKELSYIHKPRECPPDINEAVSSLIFASARCENFPGLYMIRKLLAQRYGKEFATASVELLPGNFVNEKLKENLSVKSVSDDMKYTVVDEIARDKSLQPKVEEYILNQFGECDDQKQDTIAGCEIHSSEVEEIDRDLTLTCFVTKPSDPESTLIDTSSLVSTVQQFPLLETVENVDHSSAIVLYDCDGSVMGQDESPGDKLRKRSTTKRKCTPEKRLRRRSPLLVSHGIMETEYMMYYQKPYRGPSSQMYHTHYRQQKKNLLEGVLQLSYPQKRVKQHASEKEKCIISYGQGGRKGNAFYSNICDCNLDQPCYCCFYTHEECWEAVSVKPQMEIKSTEIQEGEIGICLPLCHDESNKGMELVTQNLSRALSMPPRWSKDCTEDNLLRTQSCPSQRPKHVHPKLPDYDDFFATLMALKKEACLKMQNGSNKGMELVTHNLSRALSMPPRWSKDCTEDNLLRTHSCPSQQPKHVHPKLPDYDDFFATLMALKKEACSKMQNGSNKGMELVTHNLSRALSMPPRWSKDCTEDNLLRTHSCPSQRPKHVHPKLPDYDDFFATLMALKKAEN